jgi:hypothetical protein
MHKKSFSFLVYAVAWLVLAGPGFAAAKQGDPPEAEGETEEPNPMTIPAGYRSDPAGRRDPFVNPVTPAVAQAARAPIVRPPGLPGVLLNEAELSAIVRSPDPGASVVVINAPGSRVFVAHAGDELYDVVIREIRGGDVIFEVKPLEGDDPLAPRPLVARALTQENN